MDKLLAAFQITRPSDLSRKANTKEKSFSFRLRITELGVAVDTVDSKGVPVNPNYQYYTGNERQLLNTLDKLRERQDFLIDWDNPDREIYLGEHPYLLNLLMQCSNIVDENLQAIAVAKEAGRLRLWCEELEEQKIQAAVKLHFGGATTTDFVILTENAILTEQQIVRIDPTGEGFASVFLFNTHLDKEELPLFLSLSASYLPGVPIDYKGYPVRDSEDIIEADACLVFNKVDADQSLYLLVGQTLPGISLENMQRFPVPRYAQINELEQTIVIRQVRQQQFSQLVGTLESLLKKGRGRSRQSDYFREENLFIIVREKAEEFITEHLPFLLQHFRVLGAEQLRHYKIVAQPPQLNMRLSHNIDFLEGDVEVSFDNEQINLFDMLRQYRKQKYIVLNDGSKAIVDEQYIRKLERIFKPRGKSKKAGVTIFDLPLIEELAGQASVSPFKKARSVFTGFNDIQKKRDRLPALKAELRPYQKYGFKWLNYLRKHELGGCLADDMGLGKTLQAISVLAKVYQEGARGPSLVVCPRSLLQNWHKELSRFAPQLNAVVYYGPHREWQEAAQSQIIITTYALMRNDIEQISEVDLEYVVLDESQNIKNQDAQTTRAALLLKARHRLAISGTPIENNLGELYSLFRFLNPGMFGTAAQFNADYAIPIQRDNDADATHQLRKKIFPFILRRKKQDVLADLPDKVEQVLYVDMSEDQAKLYETRRQFYQEIVSKQVEMEGVQKSQFIIFQALNELRQIATIPEKFSNGKVASAKRELLLEQLQESLANGHKALIFVNFLAAVDILAEDMEQLGIDFVTMTGSTRNRQALVDRFQEDKNCRVFLLTLKTGGTGLNLTAASTVFIYDPWWNIAAENQAIDRTHRIGQLNKVHALRLLASGTIEEKIRQLQEKKQELFDNIIGTDGASLKRMSEEDVNFILGK